jgi:hypothetical protein
MRTSIITLLLLPLLFTVGVAQSSKTKTNSTADVKPVVKVMYFHGERRCKTCLGIQDIAEKTVLEMYGKDARVKFVELNHEKEENAALVEKYQIAGSSLIVQGPGKKWVDLTAKAFQYALADPGKLQDALLRTIKAELR